METGADNSRLPGERQLVTLFPSVVAVAVAVPGEPAGRLYPEEQAALARAVDKRRTEFAVGRTCARRALALLGAPVGPIPVGSDRGPVWPSGYVGSITHCEGFVAAVAGRLIDFAGIGMDAERSDPLDPRLAHMICTDAERADMNQTPPPGGTDWAKLIFSAKEAVHKAVAPIARVTLSFHDVEIRFDLAGNRFSAVHVGQSDARLPDFTSLDGRFLVAGGLVVTSVCIPTADGAHTKNSGAVDGR